MSGRPINLFSFLPLCRWLDYTQFNRPIEGLPIMACKVPLKKVGNKFLVFIYCKVYKLIESMMDMLPLVARGVLIFGKCPSHGVHPRNSNRIAVAKLQLTHVEIQVQVLNTI